MDDLEKIKGIMTDGWMYIKKHLPAGLATDEEREKGFRELNDLMRKHHVPERGALPDFAFSLFAAAFDLLSNLGGWE